MNQDSPKTTKRQKPRRKLREWFLLLLVVSLLVLIPQLETHLIDLTAQLPISNSIIALGLINLNILLVLLFLFLIFRNIFKLIRKDAAVFQEQSYAVNWLEPSLVLIVMV